MPPTVAPRPRLSSTETRRRAPAVRLDTAAAAPRRRRRTVEADFRTAARATCFVAAGVGVLGWFLASEQPARDALCAALVAALVSLAFRPERGGHLRPRRAEWRRPRSVLLVGSARSAAELTAKLRTDKHCVLRVLAVCLTDPAHAEEVTSLGVPVLGGMNDVLHAARRCRPDAVVALPSAQLSAEGLRELVWALRTECVEVLLAPVLADVAARRIELRMAAGMPLLLVRTPNLSRAARIPKALTDRVLAVLGLVLLAPLMAAIAVVVRLDTPGPVFFRQRRLGLDGRAFTMIKFRSMQRDAEHRKAGLAELNQHRDGLLFKIVDDPRITRAGLVLRRYSLDELPQLFNVAAGQMSLVGPRPLSAKPGSYTEVMKRRLLVKPGMTGLWQVSGRSDLSWEQSLHLDLSYVENWSPVLDLRILLCTAAVVVRGTGAY
ncbi:sugar transferase [Streptomyces sp. NBC_00028]